MGNGMLVFKTSLLPFEETAKACDIETKEEITIFTGEIINAFVRQDKMYVSEKVYELMKKLPQM